jgi:hypothetical protein
MASDAHEARSALSLPDPVLAALSIPGIDAARFGAVVEALGLLPIEGQVELANRLIGARSQYVVHRMSVCDGDCPQGLRCERLGEIGDVAARLLRLLHRNGTDPRPWNLHPAITLALPRLFEISLKHRSGQIWGDQGLTRLEAMLTDLVGAGAEAETIFPAESPRQHGGSRRAGPTPATGLVADLIAIYAEVRAKYPKSGPEPAFDAHLKGFVRAALAFVVGRPPEFMGTDRRRYSFFEARFLETDLSKESRTTDDMIRGIFYRLHRSSRKQT